MRYNRGLPGACVPFLPDRPSPPLAFLGGGEHARVVRDAVVLEGLWDLQGCFAPDVPDGMPRLGGDSELLAGWGDRWSGMALHLALVGMPGSGRRRRIAEMLQALDPTWATVRHPRAWASPDAVLGPGCFLAAGAVVNPGARLGRHALINTGSIVEHDVTVGEGAHLAPGAVVGGGAQIGAWAVLGLGCRVRDHVRIGAGAVVAMGAVVVSDVPGGAWVAGVPARPMAGRDPHA